MNERGRESDCRLSAERDRSVGRVRRNRPWSYRFDSQDDIGTLRIQQAA